MAAQEAQLLRPRDEEEAHLEGVVVWLVFTHGRQQVGARSQGR